MGRLLLFLEELFDQRVRLLREFTRGLGKNQVLSEFEGASFNGHNSKVYEV